MRTTLSGWGRYPLVDSDLLSPRGLDKAASLVARADGLVARGNGRSYGDAAVGLHQTAGMSALDRMTALDMDTGRVTVEAGILLADLIAFLLPRGLFPFVVPGTKFVTVGGAIASDVHGKNHHIEGGFGRYVEGIELATPKDGVLSLSRQHNPELFYATIGGMGLTGVILKATLRMRHVETGFIRQTTLVAQNIAEAIGMLADADTSTYSVAWIDCLAKGQALGRSLIYLGEHATRDEIAAAGLTERFAPPSGPRRSIPVDFPGWALNRMSMTAFNELYFRRGARPAKASAMVAVDPYFFPLDGIGNWNRIYGRRGFVQHQCVIPEDRAEATLTAMLERISARGNASFLAVLKKLGSGDGLISFPNIGYTLALDFALGDGVFEFLDELDRMVVDSGGRLYLAKDARQSRATFEAGYPELDKFRAIRTSVDPDGQLRSHLSERLGL